MAVPDLRVRQKQQELSGVKPGDILVTNQVLVFKSRDKSLDQSEASITTYLVTIDPGGC